MLQATSLQDIRLHATSYKLHGHMLQTASYMATRLHATCICLTAWWPRWGRRILKIQFCRSFGLISAARAVYREFLYICYIKNSVLRSETYLKRLVDLVASFSQSMSPWRATATPKVPEIPKDGIL